MKNKKSGFVLAEAIIVAVFVVGLFTYIAINIIPLLNIYKTISNYDNPNEIYAINVLYDEIIGHNKISPSTTKYRKNTFYNFTNNCKYNTDLKNTLSPCETDAESALFDTAYFKELLINHLEIKWLAVFEANSLLGSFPTSGSGKNNNMIAYRNYLKEKGEIPTGTTKIIIAEFNNGKYAHIIDTAGKLN